MRRRHPLLLAVALATLLGACSSADGVVGNDAWTRPVPPNSPARAIYLEISNGLDADVRLTGASSEECSAIELHETTMDDAGVMAMRALIGGLEIAPGQKALLAPGGAHLMCLDPGGSTEQFELRLELRDAADVTVTVVIEDR